MNRHPEPIPSQTPPKRPSGLFGGLRSSFLTGLVVIAPIGVTFWLIWTLIGMIDNFVLPFIPDRYNPAALINKYLQFEIDIRGLGVIIFLIFTVTVGWIAKGMIGRSLIRWAEYVVETMPVVRSIYGGLKQITETVLAQGETSFDRACLVEYPRRGIWAIAFVSTGAKGEIRKRSVEPMISVFLPTTPNPTSGFLLFVPERDVIFLDMSVEEAAKLVISAGLVYPNGTVEDPKVPTA